ncbi:Remorin family protein isoform 3 [Hibiscus syriacus]|uniref:Remorin family protein isoform 3 n=1 Tax=Hibiscus syriacus TaxID=106335 RepID=A0A6A2W9D8_HIBSY|nr:Remorin family protein isoform 3 [Hibiscus syriacus]
MGFLLQRAAQLVSCCTKNPGIIVEFETQHHYVNDRVVRDRCQFYRVFWTYPKCINTIKYCKSVVQIDGTFLFGKYKERICIISDQGAGIKAAMDSLGTMYRPPHVQHHYCFRHIAANYYRKYKNNDERYELLPQRSESMLQELFGKNKKGCEYIMDISKEMWTNAYDGGYRYGHMTTNLAEAINSTLKGARHLPVKALVKTTYFRLGQLFTKLGGQTLTWMQNGYIYHPRLVVDLQKKVAASNGMLVTNFSRTRELFRVTEMPRPLQGIEANSFRVNLQERWCDCGFFQALKYTCSHVIAACSHSHLDYKNYVDLVYQLSQVFKHGIKLSRTHIKCIPGDTPYMRGIPVSINPGKARPRGCAFVPAQSKGCYFGKYRSNDVRKGDMRRKYDSDGVIAANGLTIHTRSPTGGFAIQTEPCMARSVSVHGCSRVVNPSLLSSQVLSLVSSFQLVSIKVADENLDATKDAVFDISDTVSRRDAVTQMSPQGSTQSSKGWPFSPPHPPPLLLYVSWNCSLQSIHCSKSEVRDVQVDERDIMTRWSKKHGVRNSGTSTEAVHDQKNRAVDTPTSSWDMSETAKHISKFKREAEKISAWENLQKAKAEAAIRKLEMKLEKKRSSSMDKIMNKLSSAQKRAQEMRGSMIANEVDHVTRSTHNKAISFHRARQMGSLSGCFTCHAI